MAKKKLVLYLALIMVLLVIFLPGFSKYQRLLSEKRDLKEHIEKLEELNKQLENEKEKLENDIEYVERKAREKLGIVKKDEIPYKIIEEGGE